MGSPGTDATDVYVTLLVKCPLSEARCRFPEDHAKEIKKKGVGEGGAGLGAPVPHSHPGLSNPSTVLVFLWQQVTFWLIGLDFSTPSYSSFRSPHL